MFGLPSKRLKDVRKLLDSKRRNVGLFCHPLYRNRFFLRGSTAESARTGKGNGVVRLLGLIRSRFRIGPFLDLPIEQESHADEKISRRGGGRPVAPLLHHLDVVVFRRLELRFVVVQDDDVQPRRTWRCGVLAQGEWTFDRGLWHCLIKKGKKTVTLTVINAMTSLARRCNK